VEGWGSNDRPARTSALAALFFRSRTISFLLPPAFSRLATPLPTNSETLRVAPLPESAIAVAAPVTTPVAIPCFFTALRTDFPIDFVLFFFFIA